MPRTTKADRKEAVKTLLDLRKEQERLQTKLADVNSRMPAAEEKVAKVLGSGLHTFGKWVVNVYSKKTGGRASPSWKSIAEDCLAAVDDGREVMLDKYPDDEAGIMAYAEHLGHEWHAAKKKNTKTSEVKHTTVVEMTKADTTA